MKLWYVLYTLSSYGLLYHSGYADIRQANRQADKLRQTGETVQVVVERAG